MKKIKVRVSNAGSIILPNGRKVRTPVDLTIKEENMNEYKVQFRAKGLEYKIIEIFDDNFEKKKTITSEINSVDEQSMIAIEIAGKNPEVWALRNERFFDRMVNSFKKFFGYDIPSRATAEGDINDAVEAIESNTIEK